jgi:hypothetical protein
MPIVDKLASIASGNFLDGVKGLVDEVHESPEEKAQAAQAMAALDVHKEEIELGWQQQMAAIQGKSIQTEAASADKFVSRARPTFLYLMYLVILYSFILQPLILMALAIIGLCSGKVKWTEIAGMIKPLEIPGALYELFAAGYLGYSALRTGDKFTAAVQAVSAMPGDSQTSVKLPFGLGQINVGNNSAPLKKAA